MKQLLSADKNVRHRCCIVTPMVHGAAARRAAGPRGGAEADAQSENDRKKKSRWEASAPFERGRTMKPRCISAARARAAKRSAAPQPSRALAWGVSRCVIPPSAGGHARRGRTPCHAHTSVMQSRGEWSFWRCKRASLLASLSALRRLLVAPDGVQSRSAASCAAAAPTRQTPGRRSSVHLPRRHRSWRALSARAGGLGVSARRAPAIVALPGV